MWLTRIYYNMVDTCINDLYQIENDEKVVKYYDHDTLIII